MSRKYTSFSQLSGKQFEQSSPAEPPKKASVPGDSAENDVLAYFSRKLNGQTAKPTLPARETRDVTAEVRQRLAAVEDECRQAKTALAETESRSAAAEAQLAKVQKELLRLQGECGQLKGELAKLLAEREQPEVSRVDAVQSDEKPVSPNMSLLAAPAKFVEAFPGEIREMVVATLAEGFDAAAKGARERRAAVLSAVLANNKSSGELERRRAKLKQILKDCGYKVEPHVFESVGMKLISGRTHWKLQYADVRMPISKTPSDFRASLNAAADMANRCF